jgi:hypothetical protein
MSIVTRIIWIFCALLAAIFVMLGSYEAASFLMLSPIISVLGDIADNIKQQGRY